MHEEADIKALVRRQFGSKYRKDTFIHVYILGTPSITHPVKALDLPKWNL